MTVRRGMVESGFALATDVAAIRALFVGTIQEFPFTPSDPWWIPYDGRTLNTADYPLLASRMGATGPTFTLGDRRGRVAAGRDNLGGTAANRLTNAGSGVNGNVLGATGGAQSITLTEAQIPAHDHTATATVTDPGHVHTTTDTLRNSGGGGNTNAGGTISAATLTSDSATTGISVSVTVNDAGGSQAHGNVQPTIVHDFYILAY